MSAEHDARALLARLTAPPGATAAADDAETTDWVLHELRFVRYHAQAEADDAYERWRQHPGARAFAIYRAASDRADAAQDALAQWVAEHGDAGGQLPPDVAGR